jgi:hypothetical protein
MQMVMRENPGSKDKWEYRPACKIQSGMRVALDIDPATIAF